MFNYKVFFNWFIIFNIVFTLLFFIPITSKDYYYDIVYGDLLFNRNTLIFILITTITVSLIIYLKIKTNISIHFLMLIALAMIVYTFLLIFFNINPNYFTTGFILLMAPLINSMNITNIKNILIYYSFISFFYTIAMMVDTYLSIGILPIYEIRYLYAREISNEFRLSTSGLFGQGNATGSSMSILGSIFVYFYFKEKDNLFLVLAIAVGVLIYLSGSATGFIILVSYFIFSIYHTLKIRYFFKVCILLTISWIVILSIIFPDIFLHERKISSISIKLNLLYDYFLLVNDDIIRLFFKPDIIGAIIPESESSFLDMILNFGIFIPLLIVLFIFICILKSVQCKDILLGYLFLFYLAIMVISNSSFLLPNIILLLILVRILNEHKKVQYI